MRVLKRPLANLISVRNQPIAMTTKSLIARSTKWMKTAFAVCAFVVASVSMSLAATQVQTNTLDCGTAGSDFSFLKFNTSLGTLTGITLTASGSDIGSFSITNNLGTPDDVSQPKDNFITLTYVSEASVTQPLATNKSLVTGDTFPAPIGALASSTFTLIGSSNSFTPYTDNYASSARWTNYTGLGNVHFTVDNAPQVTTTGGFYTANTTGVVTRTQLILTYTYTVTPVPEPSTWAGIGAALGGLIFVARSARRKQDAEPSDSDQG